MGIPYERWQPLSVAAVTRLFQDAPFVWCLAGGYMVEQFLGKSLRRHGDIDIVVFRDDQRQVQSWLQDWVLYAADPPGTLRKWASGEILPEQVHDIWGHQTAADAWQLQIMLAEAEGTDWVSRRSRAIRGPKTDFIRYYQGIPCLRIEIQLMYKAKGRRAKDELDFQACLPLLDQAAKVWLSNSLHVLHPEGHPWLDLLNE